MNSERGKIREKKNKSNQEEAQEFLTGSFKPDQDTPSLHAPVTASFTSKINSGDVGPKESLDG